MTGKLRAASLAAAVGTVVAFAIGCGSKEATLTGAGSPSPSISPVSERGTVPWVDRPGRYFQPKLSPAHWLPADARPCAAAQLLASFDGGNGATGHNFAYFLFRNVGRTACMLRGFPSVVASEPGKPDVTAVHSGWFVSEERSGNMPRGGVTMLSIETDRDCAARYANPNKFPTLTYHTVTVGIPGGGHVLIKHAFDVLCGLSTGRFSMRQPPRRYPQSPVHGARATLELPSGVVAGATLEYGSI